MIHTNDMIDLFHTRFTSSETPRLFRAPGRVNLIGDHTDYNDGFVLPLAIDRQIVISAAPRIDKKVNVYSENFSEWDRFSLEKDIFRLPGNSWRNYLRAMAWSLTQKGFELRGMDAVIYGDIPIGAGLSSSAAMEVVVGFALLSLSDAQFTLPELALTAQRAENDFVGMRCGIMDQLISCIGEENRALLIDCRYLSCKSVPLAADTAIVIVESGVQRGLVDGEYNNRRSECENAAAILGVPKLRDIDISEFGRRETELPEPIRRRARHVVSENHRTCLAADALSKNIPAAAGRLMSLSHDSLREDFQVSCPELNQLVKIAVNTQGVFGARLTGAGFGGCMVALIEAKSTEILLRNITNSYTSPGGKQATAYICRPSKGVSEIIQSKFKEYIKKSR